MIDMDATRCADDCVRVRFGNRSYCLTDEEAERLRDMIDLARRAQAEGPDARHYDCG